MNYLLLLCPVILCSCGNGEITRVTETGSPVETYKAWINCRITCNDSASWKLITRESRELNSIHDLNKGSEFVCGSNDYKPGDFKATPIPIRADSSKFQRYHFDFAIINLTKQDTVNYKREYTFESEENTWKMVYLGKQIEELHAALFQSKKPVDYAVIEKEIERCLAIDPYNSKLHYYRALCYSHLEKPFETEQNIQKAIDFAHANNPFYYAVIGDAYRRTGNFESALTFYKLALKESSNRFDSAYFYGYQSFTFDLMNQSDSMNHYNQLAQNLDTAGMALSGVLGTLYGEIDSTGKAILYYDKWYGYDPENPDNSPLMARHEYVKFLLDMSYNQNVREPYLRHAKEICQSVDVPNSIFDYYEKEIDEQLSKEFVNKILSNPVVIPG